MLKLLITHPYYWPYVRRGAEGYIYGLSQYLSKRGYEIEIITSKPGKSETTVYKDIPVHYWHQFENPLLKKLGIRPELSFMPNVLWSLLREKFDIAHSFFYTDGFAAYLSNMVKSTRYIVNFNGVPVKAHFSPRQKFLIKKAFQSASSIIVFSEHAKNYLWEDYKKEGIIIPGAVDLARFNIAREKDLDRPKILCTAAINEPRKNVHLLVKAFELFKTKVPRAILQLSGHVDPQEAQRLINSVNPQIRESIHVLGVGNVQDLPRLYAEAAFSVLPSIGEAFGIVLIESLACGTPVVGTDNGGIPEIICDPKIGVLFKYNPPTNSRLNIANLCEAMLQALNLAHAPETADRCREHAKQYDWNIIGRRFEEVYRMVLNG